MKSKVICGFRLRGVDAPKPPRCSRINLELPNTAQHWKGERRGEYWFYLARVKFLNMKRCKFHIKHISSHQILVCLNAMDHEPPALQSSKRPLKKLVSTTSSTAIKWRPQNLHCWGACEAQSAKRPTLDFGSGHDARVLGSSPALGSTFHMEPA